MTLSIRSGLMGLAAAFLLGMGAVSCQGMDLPGFPFPAASATSPALVSSPTDTQGPTPVEQQTAAPTRETLPRTLTVWVPPEFDPQASTTAGRLLAERLDAFAELEGGALVSVRVKAVSGPAGLVDSLSAASAAAPGALPDLIALPRSQMQAAALKGLLLTMDQDSAALAGSDWYPYARDLASVEGSDFGLPFAGDALALLYRPAQVGAAPADWPALQAVPDSPLVFAAADSEALLTLALYLAEGGSLQDETGRPILQEAQISRVLEHYAAGAQAGLLPAWLTEIAADETVWKTYSDGTAGLAFTWLSHYLLETPPDTAALALPSGSAGSLTLADGWLWCLPAGGENQAAVRLAEYLTAPDFLAGWTEAAGVLPTRPSALAGWAAGPHALLEFVALSARARPSNDVLFSLGPVLKEAVLQTLQGVSPADAAATAANRLRNP